MTSPITPNTYAEDLPCWKTGGSSPDRWIEKAKVEIERAGGEVLGDYFGNEGGLAAFVLKFRLEGEELFKIGAT